MSGIYIPGVELPKEGNWITLRVSPGGQCFLYGWCGDDFDYMELSTAVPVPEHGRLVDADALMAKDEKDFSTIMEMTDLETVFGTALADAHAAIQEMLKTAPTIIPAEERDT